MSWTRPERGRRSLVFRLTATYATVFSVSALLLFGLAYHMLRTGLKEQEREGVEGKLVELAGEYRVGGIAAVSRDVDLSTEHLDGPPFVVRVADPRNRPLFVSPREAWGGFDPSALDGPPPREGTWIEIQAPGSDRVLEMAVVRLPDGNILEVGRAAARLDRALARFREAFGATVVPLLLLGVGAGWFLARRALGPVRDLARALDHVDPGGGGGRVPSPGTADELEALVSRFNRLLDRIDLLVRAMRESLDNVAHDIRTPVTRLRGTAEVALTSGGGPEELREALADCVEEADRIEAMLRTVLDISEAETGMMELRLRVCDLGAAVREVAELFWMVAEERGVALEIEVPGGLAVRADPVRLHQVLANLVDNAIKYTPPGGRVWVRARPDGGGVVVQVADTGIGIDPSDQTRIWERLYRADASRGERGLGLGLSLVRAVVEAHGGRVGVDSEPGRGSVFTVWLPSEGPDGA